MRTKEQLRDIIAQRLQSKLFKAATFSDLVEAISGATPEQKQKLIDHLIGPNKEKAINMLYAALKIKFKSDSIANANAIVADDSLSLEELDSII